MEKVERDGKVAVLYSPDYGAGWYTWNTSHPEILFHPRLVELVEQDRRDEITDELMEEILGLDEDSYVYIGGACNLSIEWVNKGQTFYIHEYDGHEHVVTRDERNLIA